MFLNHYCCISQNFAGERLQICLLTTSHVFVLVGSVPDCSRCPYQNGIGFLKGENCHEYFMVRPLLLDFSSKCDCYVIDLTHAVFYLFLKNNIISRGYSS